MSELYTSSPEGEPTTQDGVSEWQRSLGAEAPAEAPAPLEPVVSAEAAPVTPDRRPSPVEPVAPLPAEPSSSDEGTEATTETDAVSEDEGGVVVQRLFVGPSDNIPLLDVDRLRLRREVGCSATPTMGPSRVGDLTEGEMSDIEDEMSDVGDVPNEAGRFAEFVFTDQALMAMVGVPVWVLLAALVAVIGYLCLLIGSGIIAVRR